MSRKTSFKDLNLSNAFLFSVAMSDSEICRSVLERILGIGIRKVHVRAEENMGLNPEYRGIRLDIIADDAEGTLYNVEMQTSHRGNLPKRGRLYQAEMDVTALFPGEDFNHLPRSYVIFICTFDPFFKNRCKYTYTYQCKETGEELEDGTTRIYLNTRGEPTADLPEGLAEFLKFVENTTEEYASSTNQEFLIDLSRKITEIKNSRRMEGNYMLFEELLEESRQKGRKEGRVEGESIGWAEGRLEGWAEGEAKGRAEGRAEGEAKGRKEGRTVERDLMLNLIRLMDRDSCVADIPRLAKEPAFFQEMVRHYHLDA